MSHSAESQPDTATSAFEADFTQHRARLEAPVPENECALQLADPVDSADSATKIFL